MFDIVVSDDSPWRFGSEVIQVAFWKTFQGSMGRNREQEDSKIYKSMKNNQNIQLWPGISFILDFTFGLLRCWFVAWFSLEKLLFLN